jgi:carboxymethylenebutenolidase
VGLSPRKTRQKCGRHSALSLFWAFPIFDLNFRLLRAMLICHQQKARKMNLTRPEGPKPLTKPSRRNLGAIAMFAGYAAAVTPVHGAAISTPSDGLITGMVSYPSHGFDLPAFVARPSGRGRKPVVIVVSEIFGLHEYVRDMCRRLARLGYVAIAPAFFVRVADPAPLTDFNAIMPIVAAASNDQVMGDLSATIAWLDRQRFVAKNRIAITGFCWGGTVVWMASALTDRIKAGVAWYGRLAARPGATEARKYPPDLAGTLKSPVLGLYAENDSGIPLPTVEAMRAALATAGNTKSEIIVYPSAQHGFHADYRPSYKEDAAIDGWARMLAWFATNGV